MKKTKDLKLSDNQNSLKLIDGELWSCQDDGIAVYDENLKRVRTIEGAGNKKWVNSVVLLSDDTVVVAGCNLYQSSKSGLFVYHIFLFLKYPFHSTI